MSQDRADLWQPTKFKFLGRIVSGGTPESGKPEYWDGPVTWLTPVDLGKNGNDAIRQSGRTITEKGVKAAGLAMLPIGAIVISTRAPIGSVGLLAREAATNQGCKALVPRPEQLDSRFGFYYSLDAAEKLQSLGLGTTFVELSTYALKNLTLNSPPLDTQQLIASYLDEQTAKLDRLMDMRRRQIELLKKQRLALIQQAVTRGLNPDIPMRDSGLPWLGIVPAHWGVLQLRRIIKSGTSITYGIVQAGPHIEGGVPYIRTSNMSGDVLPIEGYLCTTPEIDQSYQRSKIRAGDVVVAIRATIGKVLPVPLELDGANLTQGTAKVSPGSRVTTDYLLVALRCESARQQFASLAKGTTFLEITLDMLRRFTIPLPPLDEQFEIVSFINTETAKLDNLRTAYKGQLTLLAEYRTALIHECVTGQRQVPDIPASLQEEAHAL